MTQASRSTRAWSSWPRAILRLARSGAEPGHGDIFLNFSRGPVRVGVGSRFPRRCRSSRQSGRRRLRRRPRRCRPRSSVRTRRYRAEIRQRTSTRTHGQQTFFVKECQVDAGRPPTIPGLWSPTTLATARSHPIWRRTRAPRGPHGFAEGSGSTATRPGRWPAAPTATGGRRRRCRTVRKAPRARTKATSSSWPSNAAARSSSAASSTPDGGRRSCRRPRHADVDGVELVDDSHQAPADARQRLVDAARSGDGQRPEDVGQGARWHDTGAQRSRAAWPRRTPENLTSNVQAREPEQDAGERLHFEISQLHRHLGARSPSSARLAVPGRRTSAQTTLDISRGLSSVVRSPRRSNSHDTWRSTPACPCFAIRNSDVARFVTFIEASGVVRSWSIRALIPSRSAPRSMMRRFRA